MHSKKKKRSRCSIPKSGVTDAPNIAPLYSLTSLIFLLHDLKMTICAVIYKKHVFYGLWCHTFAERHAVRWRGVLHARDKLVACKCEWSDCAIVCHAHYICYSSDADSEKLRFPFYHSRY